MSVFIQKYYPENFVFLILEIVELHTRNVSEMFIYKHTGTIEYVKKAYFLRKMQTLRVNNSRIFTIRNAKFLGYYFYINLNI